MRPSYLGCAASAARPGAVFGRQGVGASGAGPRSPEASFVRAESLWGRVEALRKALRDGPTGGTLGNVLARMSRAPQPGDPASTGRQLKLYTITKPGTQNQENR